jgi:predicted acetyltransferase
MTFQFRSFGVLSDGVLDLVVEREEPADPARQHVPCYHFGIRLHGTATTVGRIALRVGSVASTPSLLTSGQVGYAIDEAHRGHGYAARACRLLRPVAVAHGLTPLVITCAPDNLASRATCERLGARLIGIFDVPPDHPMYRDGRRTVCRYEWSLDAAT